VEECGTYRTNCLTFNLKHMSVDVEIYMNNIIKFFRENPNDLLNLVPKNKEEVFYRMLREEAIKNYEKGEEVNLTQKQIIEICAEIHGKLKRNSEPRKIGDILKDMDLQNQTIDKIIVNTPFGNYSLN
jgi:hypothetical protein